MVRTFFVVFSVILFFVSDVTATETRKPKRVATTFTILRDMAQNVAGSVAIVESITKPGAEIHDYEPTPHDIVKANSAQLVLWNGLGLERWFEKFFRDVQNVQQAIVTESITPMSIGEGPYDGKPNPHAWMSPANALIYVDRITEALSKLDPSSAEIFRLNAQRYKAEISSVDKLLRETLNKIPLEKRWLVTSEGAFSYLARDYGLQELYLWPVNADEEGTPRQIQRVIDTVRRQRIPVVFSESTISDKAMRQVSRETGARFGGVLYVDSLTEASGAAPTYLKLLQYNTEMIVRGFSASNDVE